MKRILTAAPVFLTLFLLVAGVFMPRFTSRFLDYQLQQETARHEDVGVSLILAPDWNFFDTLSSFDARQFQVNLTEGYQMTEEDAKNFAVDVMEKLVATGIGDGNNFHLYPEVEPVLIANKNDPALSGVFWYCVWTNPSGRQNVLWLDDKSGKMTAFQMYTNKSISSITAYQDGVNAYAPYQDIVASVADFCRSYYPIDEVVLSFERENGALYEYTFLLTQTGDGIVKSYRIPLLIRNDLLSFNL